MDAGDRRRIVITGGAGLVGQNLVTILADRPDLEIIVIDKHRHNLSILGELHPSVEAIAADLAEPGPWEATLAGADTVVQLHAQVTSLTPEPFVRNNVEATKRVLDAARRGGSGFLVHVSSAVVRSVYDADAYSRTKRRQEELVLESDVPHCVLRPTLMFGWFDPKHLGWLSRLMERTPVFPIPGDGRYSRQPLYVLDFCRVLEACIDRHPVGGVFDVVGAERMDYIDIIREIRAVKKLRTRLLTIPVPLFAALLRLYAMVDRRPPFTTDQLSALTAGDEFTGLDIAREFGVTVTPLREALRLTFSDSRYARVVLAETS